MKKLLTCLVLATTLAISNWLLAADVASGPGGGRGGSGGGSTSTTSYSGVALGTLPGDNQSYGLGVNDRGSVVGFSFGGIGPRAFYWNPTGMYLLTSAGATGHAHAISGGAGGPEYVAGDEIVVVNNVTVQRAVIWTSPPSGAMTYIDARGSGAFGVNDYGAAVGWYQGSAAIWSPNGNGTYSRTVIPLDAQYGDATAVAINNEGVVLVVAYRTNSDVSRAFVRRTNGTMVAIQPLGADDRTNASSISNVFTSGGNQLVYLAGTSSASQRSERGVRWTVNLDTGAVSALVLSQSWSTGVNMAGDVCGTVNQASTQNAVLWRNGTTYQLKPVKGSRVASAYDLARTATTPTYVAGVSIINSKPQAVRWEIK